ncbi:MAG: hypothetical protein Q9171_003364 [Xanthocarpia ochracea]
MVFMSTVRSIEANRKKTRSSSSTNAPEEPDVPYKSGSGIPPWRDRRILDKIPDVFTIDVDSAVPAESPEGQVIGDYNLSPNGFTIQAFSSGTYSVWDKRFCESRLTSCADDPSAAHFPSVTGGVVMNPDSSENWEMACSDLDNCRRNHPRCRGRDAESERAGFRPTHLVDVLVEGDDSIRLIDGQNLAQKGPADTGYLTLSYCWERLKEEGFPLDSQPASIQDAIKVTKALGYRYLWVDSLCIIQDDKFDMMREISHMDKIYQHSTLLISAARAQEAGDGFLGCLEQTFLDQEMVFAVPFRYQSGDVLHGHVVLQVWGYPKPSSRSIHGPGHCRNMSSLVGSWPLVDPA